MSIIFMDIIIGICDIMLGILTISGSMVVSPVTAGLSFICSGTAFFALAALNYKFTKEN